MNSQDIRYKKYSPWIVTLPTLFFLSICQSTYGNTEPGSTSRPIHYNYEVIQQYIPRRMPETFVAVTLSGGGLRAASLSYGVLTALRRTEFDPPENYDASQGNHRSTLLSEVDFVSAVSGGSVTASYWALHGSSEQFENFERDFLKKEIQSKIITKVLNPTSILRYLATSFTRSDALTDYFEHELLGNTTYRDLLDLAIEHQDRPYLVINATEMDTRSLFPFVQLQFELICEDLNDLKVARAVAASAAYPLLFPAIAFENRRLHQPPCPRPYVAPAFNNGANEDADSEGGWNDALTPSKNKLKEQKTRVTDQKKDLSRLETFLQNAVTHVDEAETATSVAVRNVAATATQLVAAKDDEAAASTKYERAKNSEGELASNLTELQRTVSQNLDEFEGRFQKAKNRKQELTVTRNKLATETNAAKEQWFKRIVSSSIDAIKKFRRNFWNSVISDPDSVDPQIVEHFVDTEECAIGTLEGAGIARSHAVASGTSSNEASGPDQEGRLPRDALSVVFRDLRAWTGRHEILEFHAEAAEPAADAKLQATLELHVRAGNLLQRIKDLKSRKGSVDEAIVKTHQGVMGIRDVIDLNAEERNNLDYSLAFIEELRVRVNGIYDAAGTLEERIRDVEPSLSRTEEDLTELESGADEDADDEGDETQAWANQLQQAEQRLVQLEHHMSSVESAHSKASEYALALDAMQRRWNLENNVTMMESELAQVKAEMKYWNTCIDWYKDSSNGKLREMETLLAERKGKSEEARTKLEIQKKEVERLRKSKAGHEVTLSTESTNFEAARSVENSRKKELKEQRGRIADTEEVLRGMEKLVRAQQVKVDLANVLERERSKAIRRFQRQIPYYEDGDTKFLHLMDGGIADNVGFTPLIEILDSFAPSHELMFDEGRAWRANMDEVAVIAVDARGSRQRRFSTERNSPGWFETMSTTVSTAIEGKSQLLAGELGRVASGLREDLVISDLFLVTVDFQGIDGHGTDRKLSSCRRAYEKIPTSWSLKPHVVDALVEMGRALVLNSNEYQDMVEVLRGKLPAGTRGVEEICDEFEEDLVDIFRDKRTEVVVRGNGE